MLTRRSRRKCAQIIAKEPPRHALMQQHCALQNLSHPILDQVGTRQKFPSLNKTIEAEDGHVCRLGPSLIMGDSVVYFHNIVVASGRVRRNPKNCLFLIGRSSSDEGENIGSETCWILHQHEVATTWILTKSRGKLVARTTSLPGYQLPTQEKYTHKRKTNRNNYRLSIKKIWACRNNLKNDQHD